MRIPFSPPLITDDVYQHVRDVLESGWITTGPKTAALEEEFRVFTNAQAATAVNSWSSGAILTLQWLGLKPGDEVIIPAYTYAATGLSVIHAGGSVVLCDVGDDFCMDPVELSKLITPRTKAVIPVDFGGMPVDYDAINQVVKEASSRFEATSPVQEAFGRIAVIADAAHSFGATVDGASAVHKADITIYSTHAVKNLTTAEGGMIVLNLPETFDAEAEEKWFRLNRLNGQTKDAFAKTKAGGWRYDIVSKGMKCNMPDICAAIGLGQMATYPTALTRRREIYERYARAFENGPFILPKTDIDGRSSSCHLFALRLADGLKTSDPGEGTLRDQIIQYAADREVALNVHFLPLPELTLFSEMGYHADDVPNTVRLSHSEISLPIYPQMTDEMVDHVAKTVHDAVAELASMKRVRVEDRDSKRRSAAAATRGRRATS